MADEELSAVETNSPSTPVVSNPGTPRSDQVEPVQATPPPPTPHQARPVQHLSKYNQLLAVIEDMGRDIRPTYAGNRTSAERLKRSIVHGRILVRECLMECERSARS
ncbi:cyclin-dependent kinase 2-associated protein 1-like [Gigantopelta aegis]|uniref:cyclin-dependent kinase 2-associated protein 1-like n=1 Tax=Gigantopelta aegis TaxID=1735272 RepID=UPI001B888CBB|nr:cyclin-dependent kinase 2-associated protein 1-like [Gigantopelta aegis]